MSLNLNKVILAGRLTANPELKTTQTGIPVTSFSLAVDRKVAKDTEKKTDFITVVAWRNTAEFITRYFFKGSPICVCGTIQIRSWNDKYDNKRYATEVIADEAHFVESKNERTETMNIPNQPEMAGNDFEFIEFEDEELPF